LHRTFTSLPCVSSDPALQNIDGVDAVAIGTRPSAGGRPCVPVGAQVVEKLITRLKGMLAGAAGRWLGR
jgi:hypothetical protein